MAQAGANCPLRGVTLDLVDVPQRMTMSQCALVPVGSELRHVNLHFLPEDPSRPPPGDGRGKGEAGGAGTPRASTRRTLAAAVASAAPRTSNSRSCSLKLCEQHFIGRVASATRLVGQVVRARRSTARRAAPDHHRTGTPASLAPQSASSTGANRCAVAQPPRAVPVRALEQCVRLLGGCCPRARTREAWCPQASGRAAGAVDAADVASRWCGSAMGVPAGRDGAPFRRRRSSRCPSAGRSLLSSAPLTRVAATRGSHRPSIRIRSSCCASGSPAAAVSSEPRLAACRRRAGQGRASARPDPCAARMPAGTVVAVVRGRVMRDVSR